MIDIASLTDSEKVNLIDNRWKDSETLWSKISESYKKNKAEWMGQPEELKSVPRAKSKVVDNRTFRATESVLNNLLGKPSKPNVIPANETDEANEIANNLQKYFLEKYKLLKIKKKVRKGLRNLFFSRIFILKAYWNKEIDDFDFITKDPRNIRIRKMASTIYDTDFVIEEVEESISNILSMFPENSELLKQKLSVVSGKEVFLNDRKIKYKEAWINGYVLYSYGSILLKEEKHPYWDWDGIRMTKEEQETLKKYSGKRRRVLMNRIKAIQKLRITDQNNQYEQYLYNYLDKPIAPYIFGTILDVEESPAGEITLIEQVSSLQEEINKRKRQISDNADLMNGRWMVDTKQCDVSKADLQAMKNNPKGIIAGPGVLSGIKIETGKELPSFVKDDLSHSINEVDNIFGTGPTFRGEGGDKETATGRAILREQSQLGLDELSDLMDDIHLQIYAWQMQFIKVRYTESHFVKLMGSIKSTETIELMQDDIEEGIEVKVIPGSIFPEDRIYKSERAFEALKAGLIAPISYFETAGFDNPQEEAKKLEMYKTNPFSLVEMTDEDIAKLQKAFQIMSIIQGQQGQLDEQGKAREISQIRQKIQSIMQSDEFKSKSPEQQQQIIIPLQQQLKKLVASAQQ